MNSSKVINNENIKSDNYKEWRYCIAFVEEYDLFNKILNFANIEHLWELKWDNCDLDRHFICKRCGKKYYPEINKVFL